MMSPARTGKTARGGDRVKSGIINSNNAAYWPEKCGMGGSRRKAVLLARSA